MSLDDLANGGFVGVFFTHGMVLVLWGVDVILGNGYGIWGQTYVALIQGGEALTGFHSRNFKKFDSTRPGSFSCGWGHVASWLGVWVLVDLASDNGVGGVVSVVWGVYRVLAWLGSARLGSARLGCGCGVWYKNVSGKCYLAFWILFCVCLYVDYMISH